MAETTTVLVTVRSVVVVVALPMIGLVVLSQPLSLFRVYNS